jgi:hypothetical protein
MNLPNASKSFRALNPHLADTGAAPELERNPGDATLAAPQAEAGHPQRVFVRVTSVRKRLLDPDNLCEKYHVDCCRYAGFLLGDSDKHLTLTTNQRKAAKGEEEHTEIQIDYR